MFLFGPRQTGKTYLLRQLFPDAPYYNLLLADRFAQLSRRPSLIWEELEAKSNLSSPVIIDEAQKLPVLIDEVHNLIETHGIRFILTGSNTLLGGRAWTQHLFPLVSNEVETFDLVRAVNYGAFQSIYPSDYPEEDLAAYCGTYLAEEIQAEGAVRRIENFSRFLQTAALISADIINGHFHYKRQYIPVVDS